MRALVWRGRRSVGHPTPALAPYGSAEPRRILDRCAGCGVSGVRLAPLLICWPHVRLACD